MSVKVYVLEPTFIASRWPSRRYLFPPSRFWTLTLIVSGAHSSASVVTVVVVVGDVVAVVVVVPEVVTVAVVVGDVVAVVVVVPGVGAVVVVVGDVVAVEVVVPEVVTVVVVVADVVGDVVVVTDVVGVVETSHDEGSHVFPPARQSNAPRYLHTPSVATQSSAGKVGKPLTASHAQTPSTHRFGTLVIKRVLGLS